MYASKLNLINLELSFSSDKEFGDFISKSLTRLALNERSQGRDHWSAHVKRSGESLFQVERIHPLQANDIIAWFVEREQLYLEFTYTVKYS